MRNKVRNAAYPVGAMVEMTVQKVLDLCNTTYRQSMLLQGYVHGFSGPIEEVQQVLGRVQKLIELSPRLG